MPLQNRADPAGNLHMSAARGLFMGNRGGRFHDAEAKTLNKRRWASKSWIVCVCDFKNRRREVWGIQHNGRASYTELFFLDEVTALAAGHRPCFECQRERALEFADCFGKATALAGVRAADMDAKLHAERLESGGIARAASMEEVSGLPDGAMIRANGRFYACKDGQMRDWTFEGYAEAKLPASGLEIVTPATTIAVLRAGYRPAWHSTA